MAWVNAEYASEVAVVSAWLAALVPWSVSIYSPGPLGSLVFAFRFPVAELQVRAPASVDGETAGVEAMLAQIVPGRHLYASLYALDPLSATTTFDQQALFGGGVAWTLGALIVVLTALLAVALYVDEEAVAARLPGDQVRIVGGLLAVATGCFAAASILYFLGRDVVGTPIPVGVVVVGALALSLLRAERV